MPAGQPPAPYVRNFCGGRSAPTCGGRFGSPQPEVVDLQLERPRGGGGDDRDPHEVVAVGLEGAQGERDVLPLRSGGEGLNGRRAASGDGEDEEAVGFAVALGAKL